MRRVGLLLVLGVGAIAAVPLGYGAGGTLTGVVGPGFTISLRGDSGGVTRLDPGAYTVEVKDLAADHSFHLRGPGGVDETTGVEEIEDATWEVMLAVGTYTFFCDVHPTSMRKTFRVGAAAPAQPKLYGTVGPGRTIKLGTKAGAKSARVKAGSYSVVVSDRSRTESFHLVGPGVNRRTGKAFRGTATWKLTLRKGAVYRYFSDARPTLKGTLRAT